MGFSYSAGFLGSSEMAELAVAIDSVIFYLHFFWPIMSFPTYFYCYYIPTYHPLYQGMHPVGQHLWTTCSLIF
jgi:hypothetical protein